MIFFMCVGKGCPKIYNFFFFNLWLNEWKRNAVLLEYRGHCSAITNFLIDPTSYIIPRPGESLHFSRYRYFTPMWFTLATFNFPKCSSDNCVMKTLTHVLPFLYHVQRSTLILPACMWSKIWHSHPDNLYCKFPFKCCQTFFTERKEFMDFSVNCHHFSSKPCSSEGF